MSYRTATLPLLFFPAALAACDGPRSAGEAPADGNADAAVEYAELRATVCDTLTNTFECARAIEARQLEASTGAQRAGDSLRLALATGDTVRLVDERGDASDVRRYSYQYHWSEPGLFLVQVQFYEGSRYLLVDDSTGERTRLPDWPLWSPDGRRFAVLSLDLVAGYGPNTLQVWALEDGAPVLEWETEPSEWGPADGEWADAGTLRFTQRGYCEAMGATGRGMCERPAHLRLEDDGWRVEASSEPAQQRSGAARGPG